MATVTAVATCDDEIHGYITSIGGKAVMTSSCMKGLQQMKALGYIESELEYKFDVVVMVKETNVTSNMIIEALGPMKRNSEVVVVNLLGEIGSMAELKTAIASKL